MAGMEGFDHKCDMGKTNITQYKKTINDVCFSDLQIKQIWEFYVTKSIAEQSSQSISIENYGWDTTTGKKTGLPALEAALTNCMFNYRMCFVRAKTIKDTLAAMTLSGDVICTTHPRAVVMQSFSYKHDENEHVQIDSKESRIKCLFRHMRNAFAHGNTYFFDNGNTLLEDKESGSSGTITARILLPQSALLTWITIVDQANLLNRSM